MAVSITDTDIHESHCRCLLPMYRRPPDQSRNRPLFFLPLVTNSHTYWMAAPLKSVVRELSNARGRGLRLPSQFCYL